MTQHQKDTGLLAVLLYFLVAFATTGTEAVSFGFKRKSNADTNANANNIGEELLISHVNLLLPPSTEQESVSETISASHGCFKWQNTNPALINMDTHYDSEPTLVKGESVYCARSVSVTPHVTQGPFVRRSSATIIAEDQESGRVLRCEVFVDNLVTIDIKTRTRTMSNGDDEVITVQGRDQFGNVFSSLEGLIFKWDVAPTAAIAAEDDDEEIDLPIKIVPFRESSVAVSAAVERLEAQDRQTSSVLVRGAAVGEATVSAVPILRPGVAGKSVSMVVIQPLLLEPAGPLYVTKGAEVRYKLQTIRDKRLVPVPVPSAQYQWSSSNKRVAKVGDAGLANAVELGSTKIKVKFVGCKQDTVENEIERDLHVVDPASLDIRVAHIGEDNAPPSTLVSGSGSKVLVVGHNYTLDIDAYDAHYHLIEKDTLSYDVDIPSEHLAKLLDITTPSLSSSNQHHTVQARSIGTVRVRATLKTIAGVPVKRQRPITTTKELLITAPISVEPATVRLPWVAGAPLSQFQLNSSGGSGEYKWYSNSTGVCTVSPAGVVTAVAEGVAEITVADMRNELNFAKALVVVSRPAALEFVPRDTEATVGSSLALDLAVYDSDGVLYDDCSALPIAWETDAPVYINAAGAHAGVFRIKDDNDDDEDVEYNPNTNSGKKRRRRNGGGDAPAVQPFNRSKACTAKALDAVGAGRARVTASLNVASNNDNNNKDKYYQQSRFGYTLDDSRRAVISAETVVYAFEPLRVASPALPAPVTLGAEVTYTLEGGAEPFYLDPAAFFENVTAAADPSAVALRRPTLGAKGVFTATCLAHTSQQLDIATGNMPRQNLPRPLVTRTAAAFDCALPAALLVQPGDGEGQAVAARRGMGRSTCAGLIGGIADDMERRSEGAPLPKEYHLRNNRTVDIATLVLDDKYRPFYNSSTLRFAWTSSNPEVARWALSDGESESAQKLVLGNVEGSAHVSVAVEGYKNLPAGVAAPSLAGIAGLRREFDIVLHSNVAVEPAAISVVNNPRNFVEIRAMHGSGNYIFAIDDETVARVERTTGASVRIQPLRSGVVRVTAMDACLAHSEPAVATITISDVASLELLVPDLVQVGNTIEARVKAFDAAGNPFEPSQYAFIDIDLEVDSDSAAVAANANANANAKGKDKQAIAVAAQQQLVVVERLEGGRFVLAGVAQGAPSVVATARGATTATAGGRAIATPPAQVYVFPEFRLIPDKVTMVPGASYHLRWTGGPPVRYEVSFASVQPDVVGVANEYSGVITAARIGSATVSATISAVDLITREKRVYGQANASVLVSHLTGIRIRSATGRLVAGGEEDVWVEGLGASETPLTLGALGIRFVWSIADPHVAALRGLYEDAGYSLDRDEAPYNARIVARAPGKTTITVSIGTPLPANLPAEIYTRFTASMQLTVVEPLALVSPHSVVLPPHSAFPIRTTKDGSQSLRFHVLGATASAGSLTAGDAKTPLITVDSRGVVKTYAGFGTAVVLVSDDEGSLPQAVTVTVKPVSHLQITPAIATTAATHNGGCGKETAAAVTTTEAIKHRDLMVGSVTGFEVTLRDDLGHKFDALPAEDALLSTDVSDPELIAVSKVASNSTLLVRALKPGRSVIHTVLSSSATVESYATAYVGHMVEPMLPVVHVGAAISFTTSFATTTTAAAAAAEKGSRKKGVAWYTDDSKVLKIDGTTGTARALAQGHCSVFYNGTTTFSHTEVTVAKIGKVSLADGDPSQIPIITNAPVTKVLGNNRRVASVPARKLRLRFESEEGAPFTTLLPQQQQQQQQKGSGNRAQVNHNIQVQCTVSPAAWASAQAVSDPATGEYYCAVTPVYPAPRDEAPEALILGVKASDSGRTYAVERAFKLKFQPQFVVQAPRVVRLSESRPRQQVDVRYGMATLAVAPRDPELLEVLRTGDGKYVIQPRQRDASFTTAVDIADSATGQHEVVTVSYTPQSGGKADADDAAPLGSDENTISAADAGFEGGDAEIEFAKIVSEEDTEMDDFASPVRRDAANNGSRKWLLVITLTLGIIIMFLIPGKSSF